MLIFKLKAIETKNEPGMGDAKMKQKKGMSGIVRSGLETQKL